VHQRQQYIYAVGMIANSHIYAADIRVEYSAHKFQWNTLIEQSLIAKYVAGLNNSYAS